MPSGETGPADGPAPPGKLARSTQVALGSGAMAPIAPPVHSGGAPRGVFGTSDDGAARDRQATPASVKSPFPARPPGRIPLGPEVDLPAPKVGARAAKATPGGRSPSLPAPTGAFGPPGELDLPDVDLPDVDVPDVDLLDGDLPDVDLPATASRPRSPFGQTLFGGGSGPRPPAASAKGRPGAFENLPARKAPGREPVVDLPARKKPPIAPPLTSTRAGADDGVDLPRPKGQRPERPVPSSTFDNLPARKNRTASPTTPSLPSPFAPGVLGKRSAEDGGVDLPVRKGAKEVEITLDDDAGTPPSPGPSAAGPSARGSSASVPANRPVPRRGFTDLDLPLPRGRQPVAPAPIVDLPAPRGPVVDLPAAKARFEELDLPMPKAASPTGESEFGHIDLPAPRSQTRTGGGDFGAIDLPRLKDEADFGDLGFGSPSRTEAGFGDVDLPVVKSGGGGLGGGGFGDVDLPAAKRPGRSSLADDGLFDDLDLPAPIGLVDLPAPAADLPRPKDFSELDLPAPQSVGRGSVDLPRVRGENVDLPRAQEAGFGSLDLPQAQTAGFGSLDYPRAQESGFGSLDLPVPRAPGGGSIDYPANLEADLPLPLGDDDDAIRAGAGGVQFGEIDLGDSEGVLGDAMEFGDIPQEREGHVAARVSMEPEIGLAAGGERVFTRAARPAVDAPKEKKKGRKGGAAMVATLVLALLVAGGGVALGFTPHGYFGMYFLEQFLPEAGDDAAVQSVVNEAQELASSDTFTDVRASLSKLGAARRQMGLHRGLLARSLLHESLYQVRFGDDSASAGRIGRLVSRLEQRGHEAPGIHLALAAHYLQGGHLDRAQSELGRVRDPSDPYVGLVGGELALARGEPEEAVAAFRQSLEAGGATRAQWGIARSRLLSGPGEEAHAAVEATLGASPRHAGALVAKARMAWEAGERDEALVHARRAAGTEEVDGESIHTNAMERAQAWTLIGRIEEQLGSRGRARTAYEAALAANPHQPAALLGAGRLLLHEGRYQDAIARFRAVIDSGTDQPDEGGAGRTLQTEAKLGAARAMIALEMYEEARTLLQELLAVQSEDPDVVLYLGKVSEAAEDNTAAEQNYREAIRLAPERFDGYVALAELFFEADRDRDADAVLTQARQRVAESAAMRRMLGEMELARNELTDAESEFRRAIELDASDLSALFGLGVTLRRSGKLEEAERRFGELAARDEAWPGLALERGLVYEAQGRSARAVEMYQRALEERPGDVDLELRVGAALVAAGRIEEAEEKLEKVMEERPNSPEAEHFMGRVLFARGDLPGAMQHLIRAVGLDGTRAEFHLYVAWAALEQGQLGRAKESVQLALDRDPSLGDAYWIRGRTRVQTAEVRDALTDLRRALELKPSRFEAYAAMGDAYDQLRQMSDAIRSYERALEQDAERGYWWYRLGQLRMDAGQRGEAQTALRRATTIGDREVPQPGWLADAHRLEGDALRYGGDRAQAIQHYQRYLELAPENAIDRRVIEDQLADMGASQ
jgi:tetratricopeptide (TPR) repeat protein